MKTTWLLSLLLVFPIGLVACEDAEPASQDMSVLYDLSLARACTAPIGASTCTASGCPLTLGAAKNALCNSALHFDTPPTLGTDCPGYTVVTLVGVDTVERLYYNTDGTHLEAVVWDVVSFGNGEVCAGGTLGLLPPSGCDQHAVPLCEVPDAGSD
jgi:hypothetical protein